MMMILVCIIHAKYGSQNKRLTRKENRDMEKHRDLIFYMAGVSAGIIVVIFISFVFLID